MLRSLTENASPVHAAERCKLDIRIEAGPEKVRVEYTQRRRGADRRGPALHFRALLPRRKIPVPTTAAAPESAWPLSRNWLRPTAAGSEPS
ncbi:MAG: hypothetical protein MZV70_20980 [Desulfobacterales bacterium]|nr:hypothetical protein [Desulfobacterales bacterium]